eukprot:Skav204681  [mRNA]  locus=scaffold1284:90639:95182:- [translate_table: standard]
MTSGDHCDVYLAAHSSGDLSVNFSVDDWILEAVVKSIVCNTIGEGCAFGGLALLYNCPRTATVKATSDSQATFSEVFEDKARVVTAGEDQTAIYFVKKGELTEYSGGSVKSTGEFVDGSEVRRVGQNECFGEAQLVSKEPPLGSESCHAVAGAPTTFHIVSPSTCGA